MNDEPRPKNPWYGIEALWLKYVGSYYDDLHHENRDTNLAQP